MEEVHKEVLHQHDEDNMTRALVHQCLEMTCIIKYDVEVVDILQPLNLLINIR